MKKLYPFFQYFLCAVMVLCLLTSCDLASKTKPGFSQNDTHVPENLYHQIKEDEEIYYENVSRFLPVRDEEGYPVVTQAFKMIGDSVFMVNFSSHDQVRYLEEYDLSGNLTGRYPLSENIIGNYPAIIDRNTVLVVRPLKYGRWQIVRCNLDGTVMEETREFESNPAPTETGLAYYGDDCICYYLGFDLYIFRGLDAEPMIVDMPCYVTKMERISEDTLLLYGRYDHFSAPEYYTINIGTGTWTVYQPENSTPVSMFPGAKETIYSNGKFYGIFGDGLYVLRDGKPVLLTDWYESNLNVRSVQLMEVLNDTCALIQYENLMQDIPEYGFLVHTSEQRTKPRQAVTLASIGLDGEHRNLIYAAVLQFNQENRDYKIYYKDYNNLDNDAFYNAYRYQDEETLAKVQQNFEFDLINGIVYDCYLFPEKSGNRKLLADKNVLADLSSYLSDGQIFGCVESAYSTEQGILALPFFMKLSTLITTQDILSSRTPLTWDVLYDMAENLKPGEALFADNISDHLKTAGQTSFVDYQEKNCSFDSDAFADYAEFLADCYNGSYQDISLDVIHNVCQTYENGPSFHDFAVADMDTRQNLKQKKLKFVSLDYCSVGALYATAYAFSQENINYCGYPGEHGSMVILSSDAVFSITTVAKCPDGAGAFMQYLLSNQIQTSDRVRDFGLPVSKEAMKSIFPIGFLNFTCHAGYAGDDAFSRMYPNAFILGTQYTKETMSEQNKIINGVFASAMTTKDDLELFLRFLDRAQAVTKADAVLDRIVTEELSYISSGVRSGKEAGKIIQSRIYMYINE